MKLVLILIVLTILQFQLIQSFSYTDNSLNQCPQVKQIPFYSVIESSTIESQNDLLSNFNSFRAGNLTKEEVKSSIQSLITKMEDKRIEFEHNVTELEKNQPLEIRIQASDFLEHFKQVLALSQVLLTRLDQYEKHRNASIVDVKPVENTLGWIAQGFLHVTKTQTRGCDHWKLLWNENWFNNTQLDIYDIGENLRILKDGAWRTRNETVKLRQENPASFKPYFPVETELKLMIIEKAFGEMEKLFGKYLDRLAQLRAMSSLRNNS